jgi:hypothetical protein
MDTLDFFEDTDDMYFQGNGLWYRETSGPNSLLDITAGNNPHVGPYDRGFKYFNQLSSLIPNFSAVTITSETVNSTSQDLFTNYNTGEITDYDGETYVDLMYSDGTELPNCIVTTTEIITDPKPKPMTTDCGCIFGQNDESLSICFEKKPEIIVDVCKDIVVKGLDGLTGLYIFQQYYDDNNGNPTTSIYNTNFVDIECCNKLVDGLSMYTDVYVPQYTIDSGFVCCKKLTKCACNVSSDWTITQNPTIINGSPFITFVTLNGLTVNGSLAGNEVVVGADASLCPLGGWSTPVNDIIDPNTGLVGVGCKLTQYGLTNIGILYDAFIKRASDKTACNFSFPVINTDPTDPINTTPRCIPPVLVSAVREPIFNSVTFNWTLGNVPCDSGIVVAQFSLDGTTWDDLTLTFPTPSVSSLTATSIGGLPFNSPVFFRIRLEYGLSNDCNPPFVNCDVISNSVKIDFTPSFTPEGEGVYVTTIPSTTSDGACVAFNLALGTSTFTLNNSVISPSLIIGAYLWRIPFLSGAPYIETNAGWYVAGNFIVGSSFRIDNTGKVVEIPSQFPNCVVVNIP